MNGVSTELIERYNKVQVGLQKRPDLKDVREALGKSMEAFADAVKDAEDALNRAEGALSRPVRSL